MFGVVQVALGRAGGGSRPALGGVFSRAKALCVNSSVRLDLKLPRVVDPAHRGGERQGQCVAKILWVLFHGIDDPICG